MQHRGPPQLSVNPTHNSSCTNSGQSGRLPGACGAEWKIWAAPQGAGSSSSRGMFPKGQQGKGQHAGPGATGSVGGQAVENSVAGDATGASSSSGMHPPDCRLHQHQLTAHQNGQPPLPPPPLPPSLQPQTTSHATRLAPNSERRYAPLRTSEPRAALPHSRRAMASSFYSEPALPCPLPVSWSSHGISAGGWQ